MGLILSKSSPNLSPVRRSSKVKNYFWTITENIVGSHNIALCHTWLNRACQIADNELTATATVEQRERIKFMLLLSLSG
jgi:hypothetical protein